MGSVPVRSRSIPVSRSLPSNSLDLFLTTESLAEAAAPRRLTSANWHWGNT